MKRNNQQLIIVRRGSPGLMAGMMACIFAVLGIFTFGILFVPIAALCAVIGLINGIVGLSPSGFLVSALGAFLTFVGFTVSPALWLLLGLGAAATVGQADVPTRAEYGPVTVSRPTPGPATPYKGCLTLSKERC